FKLKYIDDHSRDQQPVVIHRAILGSVERFIGIYLEHTAGDLPLWLSPVQAVVLPVSEKSKAYGQEVTDILAAAGVRGSLDGRDVKIGAKIRQAELQKIPVMLVIGERESSDRSVSLRRRHLGDKGKVGLEEAVAQIVSEIESKERSPVHSQG
ncbi:MAG: His/Gly/Thr/Pro-type tRNA ligase C-terminal domain-containing protein, partial [Candidatus Neomarinimicrobiota bacterium]